MTEVLMAQPATSLPAPAARPARRVTFRDVFSVDEFRAMFGALLASMIGDQVAAVALAVLLYQRTGSSLIAGLGYATAYLPWLVGGPVLAALAERMPSRRVLVGCDLVRAALIGCAALPGLPVPVLCLLVLAAALLAPPFDASMSALLPQVLEGEHYPVGNSLWHSVHQGSQLVGFAAGGAAVVLLTPRGSLLLDAVSFAASALLLRCGLRIRPAARDAAAPATPAQVLREISEGIGVVVRDPRMSRPLLLGVVGAACLIVPEALAAPYAASLGAGPVAVGLIMAAAAGGCVAGSLAQGRLIGQALRLRLMWPLAVFSCLPLLVLAAHPGLVATLVLLAVAGAGSAFQVTANASFSLAAPPQVRARAFAVAMACLYGMQTVAIVLAGAAATVFAPSTVAAATGALALLATLLMRPRA